MRCAALAVILLTAASAGFAGGGSPNRVATVSLGKRFDAAEVAKAVDPALAPLGLSRLSTKEQNRALGPAEMSWYGALGYVPGNPSLYYEAGGGLSVLIFADRSLNCVRISVTDMSQSPEQRIIPTIGAISAALAHSYGTAFRHYSDLQCLHAL